MFYCKDCGDKYGYPESVGKSIGRCELCGALDECSDVPSSFLPMPKKQIDPITGLYENEDD
jgi:hypothetical protein